jgi:hypothetical protein
MKINPPKIIIDENAPFKEALFGREDFEKSLTNLIQNVSESLVVFVNAPWGAGKTTFSEMWQAYLKLQKHEVIYFNAYAADYFDDPFVSFSGEILALVDKRLNEGKGLIERREFKETAIDVGKRLAGLAAKVGLRAVTLNAVEPAHLEELSEIAAGVSEIGADVIEKEIENYTKEKDALKTFKESLSKLAAKIREEQGFPLTIIVDELDRCRPDFALRLMERIKHLFDVEGVAFILLVNRSQIESYIRTVYGNVDAEAYLLKFGSLFIELPNRQSQNSFYYENGRREYCGRLYGHYDFASRAQDGGFLITCAAIFSDHFDLTLRDIEKAFTVMALYFGSLQHNQFANPILVTLLSILKIKQLALYQSLSKGTISANQFFQQTGINQLKTNDQNFNLDWTKDVLNYCLMSDTELATAKNEAELNKKGDRFSDMSMWVRGNRNQAIPALCGQMDRFSLLPRSK